MVAWIGSVAVCPVGRAELEADQPLCVYEFPDDELAGMVAPPVPIVVTVVDSEDRPVKGAAVALMRLGDGGYTESDVRKETNPRTDASGTALLHYPILGIRGQRSNTAEAHRNLIGAVTAVHPDHGTASVELGEFFKEPVKLQDATSAPWVKIRLAKKPEGQKVAPAGSDEAGADAKSKPDEGGKPQAEPEERSR